MSKVGVNFNELICGSSFILIKTKTSYFLNLTPQFIFCDHEGGTAKKEKSELPSSAGLATHLFSHLSGAVLRMVAKRL